MSSKRGVLITGGAGYIGSTTARLMARQGWNPIVLDDLSSGHQKAVEGMVFEKGNVGDSALVESLIRKHDIEDVVHFAAYIEVGESVLNPGKYFQNNFVVTLNLLDAMVKAGAKRLVFSSTAAVYGEPESVPVQESARSLPINPYGWAKFAAEKAIAAYGTSHGLRSVCLRYFNASGADPEGQHGDGHLSQTHLITVCLKAALRKIDGLKLFGTDYPTPDGTCVRDYVHVEDLASAHVLALEALESKSDNLVLNLGNGSGQSVRQVIQAAQDVTGVKFSITETGRREGDPATLVADSSLAKQILGWKPKYPDVRDMIRHAWTWHQAHPNGYGESQ